jgi:Uma2 family endonuclease
MLSSSLVVRIPPSVLAMTDDQFFEFCRFNRDLQIERDRYEEISIMPPAGSETGNREAGILGQLWVWSEQDGTGMIFSSSAGFKLSTWADRSPDAAWITIERWNTLTPEQQQKFAPICPDFVVELRSPSDNLKPLQEKMEEYAQEPGFRLGLLIDRKQRTVYIYRPEQAVECLENPETVSADPVLPNFVLKLSKVW